MLNSNYDQSLAMSLGQTLKTSVVGAIGYFAHHGMDGNLYDWMDASVSWE